VAATAAAVAVVVAAAVIEVKDLPRLGVGCGFRPPFRSELLLDPSAVDFLEITADHYLDAGPAKQRELEALARHFVLIPHGLRLSLGSAEGIDEAYLRSLARLIETVDPPFWSEHIAYTRAGGFEIGHLTPLPWTHEAVEVLRRNVFRVRQIIDRPLILENITYDFVPPNAEMNEADFLNEVLEATDTGLLLDVTNVFCNSRNHGFDPLDFLDRLRLDRLVQIHFVGVEELNGRFVDSHARPTGPEIFNLIDALAERTPIRAATLERDEELPRFAELRPELERARAAVARSWS
jgi:uncharacterized protein